MTGGSAKNLAALPRYISNYVPYPGARFSADFGGCQGATVRRLKAAQHVWVRGRGVRAEWVAQRGLCNARESAAPVMAVPDEHPNALAVPLNDQAVAILLDLMEPIRASRNIGSAGRDTRQKLKLTHDAQIGSAGENATRRGRGLRGAKQLLVLGGRA